MSKKLLIISFSPIARDARVLKQVRLFSPKYEVTTCGFGPAPEGVKRHLELTHATLPGKTWDALLELKAYKAGYWLMPDVRNTNTSPAYMKNTLPGLSVLAPGTCGYASATCRAASQSPPFPSASRRNMRYKPAPK